MSTLIFLSAVFFILFTLYDRQHQLTEAAREDALWAAYQLDRENLKLATTLHLYANDRSASTWDALELRFEILYSRLGLLQRGEIGDLFGSEISSLAPIYHEAQQIILDMDRYFEKGSLQVAEHLSDIALLSFNLTQLTERLVVDMKGLSALRIYEERKEQRKKYLYVTLLILLVIASTSILMLLLFRHMQLTAKARIHAEAMANELKDAVIKAEMASHAKSEFLAMMSHEVRTPMNGILGMASLLQESELHLDQQQQVKTLYSSANALLSILNDILDFSKLEAGRLTLESAPFAIRDLAREVIDLFLVTAQTKHILLNLVVEENVPTHYLSDPGRLRQVLLNLVGNAIKFTHHGEVTLNISKVMPDGIRCTVEDTGIGMNAEVLETLFTPFTQADISTTRRYGGTGLGLAISRKIIEQMDGYICVQSEVGKGSCFVFEIPIQSIPLQSIPLQTVSETAQETQLSTQAVAIPSVIRPLQNPRILLVEDNKVNQMVAVGLLKKLGYSCEIANNGEEALAAVQHSVYDLILMDMQMPVMDGVTATQNIRRLDHPSAFTPIIAVTANVMPEDLQACLDAGMNDYLCKPFNKQDLSDRIEQYLPTST